MRYEKALGPAAVCTMLIAVFVGATASLRPGAPVSSGELETVEVTHAHSGRVLCLTDPQEVWSIGEWIDKALQNPRSRLDLRRMPPATNELVVEFASGERRTFHFNGGPLPADEEAAATSENDTTEKRRRKRKPRPYADVVVLEYEGRMFITDELHSSFGIELRRPSPPQEAAPVEVAEIPDDVGEEY
ncbi:MAG: hypothetical protein ACYS15_08905 [Planctomycetota bacterium]|jgi:hypothetical protein